MTQPATRLPALSLIADHEFQLLCEEFDFQRTIRSITRERLDEAICWTISSVNTPHARSRASDRTSLKKAISSLKKIGRELQRLGPLGRAAIGGPTASALLPMIAGRSLSFKYPNELQAPLAEDHPKFRIDFTDAKFDFLRANPEKAIAAILLEIYQALAQSQHALNRQPGARGGRKKLQYRNDLLCMLAQIWELAGRRTSTSLKSDFATFCERVFEYVGLPTEGVVAAIPDALHCWRNLSQKRLK